LDLETGGGQAVECGLERWNGTVTDNQMGLSSNAIDWGTVSNKLLDKGNKVGELGAGVVQVVIVEAEFGIWISSTSSLESNIKETSTTKDIGEDRRTNASVIIEDLVGDIPSVDLALISASNGSNVGLDNRSESSLVGDVLDPLWELRVPSECVSTDHLVVRSSPVDQGIGIAPAVGILRWLNILPLHAVFWGNLTTLGLHYICGRSVIEGIWIGAETEIFLALRLDQVVETGSHWAARGARGRRRTCCKGCGSSSYDSSGAGSGGRTGSRRSSARETLGVVWVQGLATSARDARGLTGPTNTTTLSPQGLLGRHQSWCCESDSNI
jgi:hypothetical protein